MLEWKGISYILTHQGKVYTVSRENLHTPLNFELLKKNTDGLLKK